MTNEELTSQVRKTLAFFSSVIKSGELWSDTCQLEYDEANKALTELKNRSEQTMTPEDIIEAIQRMLERGRATLDNEGYLVSIHSQKKDQCHSSHETRFSDSSLYDELCVDCGATDISGGGWGKLASPCSKGSERNNVSKNIIDALKAATELIDIVLPQFNWGNSALNADAYRILNETPKKINQALKDIKSNG